MVPSDVVEVDSGEVEEVVRVIGVEVDMEVEV